MNKKNKKKISRVKRLYFDETNMSYFELLNWSKSKQCSRVSSSKESIKRNLRLMRKQNWDYRDYWDAIKTIRFLKRAKVIKRSKTNKSRRYTKNEIAMKNFGYDVKKRKR